MTEEEIGVRTNVKPDAYNKKIQIESGVLSDLVLSKIVPMAIKHQTSLLENVNGLKKIFNETEYKKLAGSRLDLIKTISSHISSIKIKVNKMTEARKVANKIDNERAKAMEYSKTVVPYMEDIKNHVNQLEFVVNH